MLLNGEEQPQRRIDHAIETGGDRVARLRAQVRRVRRHARCRNTLRGSGRAAAPAPARAFGIAIQPSARGARLRNARIEETRSAFGVETRAAVEPLARAGIALNATTSRAVTGCPRHCAAATTWLRPPSSPRTSPRRRAGQRLRRFRRRVLRCRCYRHSHRHLLDRRRSAPAPRAAGAGRLRARPPSVPGITSVEFLAAQDGRKDSPTSAAPAPDAEPADAGVAERVPVRVVDQLEMVDVEEQHRQRPAGLRRVSATASCSWCRMPTRLYAPLSGSCCARPARGRVRCGTPACGRRGRASAHHRGIGQGQRQAVLQPRGQRRADASCTARAVDIATSGTTRTASAGHGGHRAATPRTNAAIATTFASNSNRLPMPGTTFSSAGHGSTSNTSSRPGN